MSRKGNCYDNSVMENFFGILKQEMYYGTTYYSFDELKEAIERYIKYYNEKRIKEKPPSGTRGLLITIPLFSQQAARHLAETSAEFFHAAFSAG